MVIRSTAMAHTKAYAPHGKARCVPACAPALGASSPLAPLMGKAVVSQALTGKPPDHL